MSVCPRNSCAGGYGNCLDVKITNACNAQCEFCIERGGLCPKSLDVDALIASAIEAKDCETVLVLGGEPLMYPYLLDYLKGIRPHKKNIYLTTNGSLLYPELADALSFYLDGINISVHHYSEFLNDQIYKTAHVDFDMLKKCIEVFHMKDDEVGKPAIPVRFNTNLVKGTLSYYKDVHTMIRWAVYMGADEIRFAELQNCEELWVDSREIFPNLPNDPFTCGCEQEIDTGALLGSTLPIKVIVKMTCGRVNRLKPPVKETPIRTGQTSVLYPDAQVRPGWVSGSVDPDYHGGHISLHGCHPRVSPGGCH